MDLYSNPLLGAGLGLMAASGPSSTPMGIGGLLAGGLGGANNSLMYGRLMQMLNQNQQSNHELLHSILGGAGSSGFGGYGDAVSGSPLTSFGAGTNSLMNLSYPQIQQISGQP